ncbi:hypothetical protein TYRP_017132 [Tyrophagus putrescentiae]|nr:hypothetical protein TYRP_017132 [Tyrophagus putrescentiae]
MSGPAAHTDVTWPLSSDLARCARKALSGGPQGESDGSGSGSNSSENGSESAQF